MTGELQTFARVSNSITCRVSHKKKYECTGDIIVLSCRSLTASMAVELCSLFCHVVSDDMMLLLLSFITLHFHNSNQESIHVLRGIDDYLLVTTCNASSGNMYDLK